MNKKEEIWKDIPDYEGYYQVSDIGRVRSLDRWITYSNGQERFYKGGIMRGGTQAGYKFTTLKIASQGRAYRVSQLVAMAFLKHQPNGSKKVVDHINGDRSDDRLENLRVVTLRENVTTCFRANKDSFSSEHIGVCWDSSVGKWMSSIFCDGKSTFLGHFDCELEASMKYQRALSEIENGSFKPDDYRVKWTSKHKGVYKREGKWASTIIYNKKQYHIGTFPTEELAYQSRLIAEQEVKDGVFLANRRAKKNKVTPTP